MQHYTINSQQLNSVLQYLQSRPWGEVNGLISTLTRLEKINIVEEKQVKPSQIPDRPKAKAKK